MYRRRSQSEDDNPPSPISTMLDMDHNIGTPTCGPGSSSSFLSKPQSPATGRSNPHTPASPHIQPVSNIFRDLLFIINISYFTLYLTRTRQASVLPPPLPIWLPRLPFRMRVSPPQCSIIQPHLLLPCNITLLHLHPVDRFQYRRLLPIRLLKT